MDSTTSIGAIVDRVQTKVTTDSSVSFALAAGLTDERYLSGEIVCPVLLSTLSTTQQIRILQCLLPPASPPGVIVQQTLDIAGELHPPATVESECRFVSVEVNERGVRITNKVTSVVAETDFRYEQLTTAMMRGSEHGLLPWHPGIITRLSPKAAPPIRMVNVDLDANQPIRFAEATGESAPFHTSAEAARAMGYPGIFAHSTNLMALYYDVVRLHAITSGTAMVRRIAIAFGDPVFPPCRVKIAICRAVSGELPQRTDTKFFLHASSNGSEVVKAGEAVVRVGD